MIAPALIGAFLYGYYYFAEPGWSDVEIVLSAIMLSAWAVVEAVRGSK